MTNPKLSEARRRSWITRKERYGQRGASRRPKRVSRETPITARQIREMVVYNRAIEAAAKFAEAMAEGEVVEVDGRTCWALANQIRAKLLRAP